MTEREKKRLLNRREYEYLTETFRKSIHTTRQVNYYFDTDDLAMHRQHITCRLRRQLPDGSFSATMKQHIAGTDQSTETAMAVFDGTRDNAFTHMGLRLMGELVTERSVIWEATACRAMLDKNQYLGKTDYELEVEYDEGEEAAAQSMFHTVLDLLMQYRCMLAHRDIYKQEYSAPSKSERFFGRRAENGIPPA